MADDESYKRRVGRPRGSMRKTTSNTKPNWSNQPSAWMQGKNARSAAQMDLPMTTKVDLDQSTISLSSESSMDRSFEVNEQPQRTVSMNVKKQPSSGQWLMSKSAQRNVTANQDDANDQILSYSSGVQSQMPLPSYGNTSLSLSQSSNSSNSDRRMHTKPLNQGEWLTTRPKSRNMSLVSSTNTIPFIDDQKFEPFSPEVQKPSKSKPRIINVVASKSSIRPKPDDDYIPQRKIESLNRSESIQTRKSSSTVTRSGNNSNLSFSSLPRSKQDEVESQIIIKTKGSKLPSIPIQIKSSRTPSPKHSPDRINLSLSFASPSPDASRYSQKYSSISSPSLRRMSNDEATVPVSIGFTRTPIISPDRSRDSDVQATLRYSPSSLTPPDPNGRKRSSRSPISPTQVYQMSETSIDELFADVENISISSTPSSRRLSSSTPEWVPSPK